MMSLSAHSTWCGLVLVSTLFLRSVVAADACYLKNSESGIQAAPGQYPCSSNGGVQVCCNIGDTCGADSVCRRNGAVSLPAALTPTSPPKAPSTTPATILTTVRETPITTRVTTLATVARATPSTTPPTTLATVPSATVPSSSPVSVSRVTSSASVSSAASVLPSIPVYPISSVAELLSSLALPSAINLIPRQAVASQNFYIGGCTDSSYSSAECSNHCTGFSMQNIVYNNSTSSWSCCGDTLAACSAPTRETFDATPPSSFDAVAPVPPPVASTPGSSAVSSATSTAASDPPRSSSVNTGLTAGIAFGVIVPILFILAASIGMCLRKRKLHARMRGQVDRALSEELAGRMRSLDSWYDEPITRPARPVLRITTPGSRVSSAPGHTFAYETPEGVRHVKLREQAAVGRRMPLQLQLSKLHFGLGPRRGRNALNRNQSGMLVSPQDMTTSPTGRPEEVGLFPAHVFESMEDSTTASTTWPAAPSPPGLWEFQRSVVSLREMDGTGINPLEQRQSDTGDESDGTSTDESFEDVAVDSLGHDGEWQVQQPWKIQKPPSVTDVDGTDSLPLPAW